MPPGIAHEHHVCWEALDAWTQAKMIEYLRIRTFDESGGYDIKKK